MLNVIVVILIIILVVVAYLVGTVSDPEQDLKICQKYNDYQFNLCMENRICNKICLASTELELREAQAYHRGKYEEQLKQLGDIRLSPHEPDEMTMEQICKEIGREIKIKK